jgi:Uncharacterized protein with SCP/PR1 domains
MSGSTARARLGRLVLIASLAATVALGAGPAAHPAAARAATAGTIEAQLLGWVNDARAKRGLVPLRTNTSLVDFAGDRATHMASTGVLAFPSCLTCLLDAYGIQRYNYGEIISWSSYDWGNQAAQSIFNGWKGSTSHWAKLMSSTFNYIGIGIAYRSSNKSTWASADLTESKDRTKPWNRMTGGSSSGTTASWTWDAADIRLQTHTAGLKNYDVQYRVDDGSWTTIRSATTAESLSLTSRARGHWYGLRVRARDNIGNVSAYSVEMRVWVP